MELKSLNDISDTKQALNFDNIPLISNKTLETISDYSDDSLDINSDNYCMNNDLLTLSDVEEWCYADNHSFTESSLIISNVFVPRSGLEHRYYRIYTNLYEISENSRWGNSMNSSSLGSISSRIDRRSFEDYRHFETKSNANLNDTSNNFWSLLDYIDAAHNNLECKSTKVGSDEIKKQFETCDVSFTPNNSIYQLGFNPLSKTLHNFSHRKKAYTWYTYNIDGYEF